MKNVQYANTSPKKDEVALLTTDKVDFRDIRIPEKNSIHQENIKILNMYV